MINPIPQSVSTEESHSGLLEKFEPYRRAVARMSTLRNPPFRTVIEKVLSPAEVVVAGRRTIMLGSNNYLGLTCDAELSRLAQKAAADYGVGTTGSRVANGTLSLHEELERDIEKFMERKHAIVFTTGHQANLSVIATLGGPDDVILLDADSHASIYDACRLSAAMIVRFRHNSAADLQKKLARLDSKRRNKLIVVEGCYSMVGDVAPLEDIVRLKSQYNAYLLVDEAHSVGVFGKHGRGIAEELGLERDIDFVTGTFSKALAGTGGFCASDLDETRFLHYSARSYMFTASGTPSSVATVRGALRIVRERPELRERLWMAARYMREGLGRLGFRIASDQSPIVTLITGDEIRTMHFWDALLEGGVYCNLFLPPATPKEVCLLRTSYSPAHNRAVLEEALSIFETAGRQVGVIS